MSTNKELYQRYLGEKGVRKISPGSFSAYIRELGYTKTIEKLSSPKETRGSKRRKSKIESPPEVADYARLFGIEKAATKYDVSERTIYKYLKKYPTKIGDTKGIRI